MLFLNALLTLLFTTLCLAIPPACLLHAVNTQDQPSDLSAVCGSGALSVQKNMALNCGNNADTAQKAFIATCSAAGTKVAAYTATSTSSSGSSTGTGSARTSSGTGMVTSTGSRTGSATVSGTGNGVQSTGAAAHVKSRKNARGAYGAAAIALVGAVAAL